MTLKFDGRPWKAIGHCVKLFASFQIHRWIQTRITVRKRSTRVKTGIFYPCDLDLQIRWMTSKTIGHLFYTMLSLCIIPKPWVNSNWSYSPEKPNLGQHWRFFVPCVLEMWWMTLKNSRAPLLYQIKLWASFQSHPWIETGVTVQKRPIGTKIGDFFPVTLEFDGWP